MAVTALGGGGGGYSGGGGGSGGSQLGEGPGGGGRSFDAGTDKILVADFQTGNGEVVITELVPEPGSIALLGVGLIGLAVVWRRRRLGDSRDPPLRQPTKRQRFAGSSNASARKAKSRVSQEVVEPAGPKIWSRRFSQPHSPNMPKAA